MAERLTHKTTKNPDFVSKPESEGGGLEAIAAVDGRAQRRAGTVSKALEGASTEPDFAVREAAKRLLRISDGNGNN